MNKIINVTDERNFNRASLEGEEKGFMMNKESFVGMNRNANMDLGYEVVFDYPTEAQAYGRSAKGIKLHGIKMDVLVRNLNTLAQKRNIVQPQPENRERLNTENIINPADIQQKINEKFKAVETPTVENPFEPRYKNNRNIKHVLNAEDKSNEINIPVVKSSTTNTVQPQTQVYENKKVVSNSENLGNTGNPIFDRQQTPEVVMKTPPVEVTKTEVPNENYEQIMKVFRQKEQEGIKEYQQNSLVQELQSFPQQTPQQTQTPQVPQTEMNLSQHEISHNINLEKIEQLKAMKEKLKAKDIEVQNIESQVEKVNKLIEVKRKQLEETNRQIDSKLASGEEELKQKDNYINSEMSKIQQGKIEINNIDDYFAMASQLIGTKNNETSGRSL